MKKSEKEIHNFLSGVLFVALTHILFAALTHSVSSTSDTITLLLGWTIVFGVIFLIGWFIRLLYLLGIQLKKRYNRMDDPPF